MGSRGGPELARALADIVGPEHVLASAEDREEYALDAFSLALAREALGELPLPDAVARPGSVEEVQAIVRLANRRGSALVPYGGGTGVMGAAAPVRGGVVLDLRRLDGVLGISPEGLTAHVQAGTMLGELDRTLARQGLMLGHDPWSQEIATVGGAISTNGVGYLAAGYGTMGEQTLGLEVVLPTGELWPSRQVSAPAGARVHAMFAGAEGTLGVITAATLRVFPLPERRAIHAFAFNGFAFGYAAILAMGRRSLRPSVIDYTEEPISAPGETLLYVAYDGLAAEVEARERAGLAICLEHSGRDLGQEEAHRFWSNRHATAEAWAARNAQGRRFARARSPWGRGPSAEGRGQWFDYLHVALPPQAVLDYRGRCEALLAQAGLQAREYGIWGRPDLFSVAIVAPPDGAVDIAKARAVSERLLELAQDLGGSLEYCHGVGLKLQRMLPRELGGGMAALGAIKAALDPNNIMNPGKLGLP